MNTVLRGSFTDRSISRILQKSVDWTWAQPDGEYFLQARLNVSLPGIDRETAQKLVDGAHLQCPYSKATHGNINVVTNLIDAGATNAA
jgi:organic hydroperoxide reductase OsmC/OhrA